MIVQIGYRLIGFDCVDQTLVLVMTRMLNVQTGCGGDIAGVVLSLPRID